MAERAVEAWVLKCFEGRDTVFVEEEGVQDLVLQSCGKPKCKVLKKKPK